MMATAILAEQRKPNFYITCVLEPVYMMSIETQHV